MRLRHSLCLAALLHLGAALAGTDINQAREADLDGIQGLGPALTAPAAAAARCLRDSCSHGRDPARDGRQSWPGPGRSSGSDR